MTTTVTIDAHCNEETTQVLIKVSGQPDITAQDGESHICYIYDDLTLSVEEVPKTEKD